MARRGGPGAQRSGSKRPQARPVEPEAAPDAPAPHAHAEHQVPREWATPRQLGMIGATLLLLLIVAAVSALHEPQQAVGSEGEPLLRDPETGALGDEGEPIFHYGWLSLLPAAVAIVLAFATRNVILALFLGIATGGIVYAFGAGVPFWQLTQFPWSRLNIVDNLFLEQLGTRDWALILFVYLWSLGGLIGLWTRTGGAIRFAEWAAGHIVRGPRTAKLFAWLVGLVFHQGGTISVLIAGTTVRPVLDDNQVSKEEAAFIVDSTASPVATLIPFNAFPFVVAAAIVGTIEYFPDPETAVAFFFRSIIFNFYAIAAVIITLLLSLHLIPAIMGMRKARERVAETGELVRPGSEPLVSKELTELDVPADYKTGLGDFFLPLSVLLTVAIGPFALQSALYGIDNATLYLAEAFFLALMAAIGVALLKGLGLQNVIDGLVQGAKGVTMAAIILALAITIKGVADLLETGVFVAILLGDLPMFLLPTLLLVAAMVVAFSTGTSFGTFAVLFPVAIPLAWSVGGENVTFLSMCFGAIVGGSVFGDKASPISDTTILSSLATGCDVMDHVVTQLPYAAAAAGIAAALYLVLGVVMF